MAIWLEVVIVSCKKFQELVSPSRQRDTAYREDADIRAILEYDIHE